jgi:hypothetical protein
MLTQRDPRTARPRTTAHTKVLDTLRNIRMLAAAGSAGAVQLSWVARHLFVDQSDRDETITDWDQLVPRLTDAKQGECRLSAKNTGSPIFSSHPIQTDAQSK